MHNMHAGLSQVLAVELMAPRWDCAAHGRCCPLFAHPVADNASERRASGGGWFGAH